VLGSALSAMTFNLTTPNENTYFREGASARACCCQAQTREPGACSQHGVPTSGTPRTVSRPP
jgi:hypothetical protein